MKYLLPCVVIFLQGSLNAQPEISSQEKELRAAGNFSEFLNAVKKNSRENCLCKQNEYVIFSFRTPTKKLASVCISKSVQLHSGFIIYRFGTMGKIELTYPDDTLNSFSKFQFSTYLRGGGQANAGMDLSHLAFSNNNFSYKLFDDYYSEDASRDQGITISNNATGKESTIHASGKAVGHLSVFRHKNIVKPDKDDEAN